MMPERHNNSPQHNGDEAKLLTFACAGRTFAMRRPADLESLWESMTDGEFAADERLPYWVEIWPASLALAEWLHARAAGLAGRVCLDLGCGLGLTALVGSQAGARVIGLDYEGRALAYARQNAAINSIASPLWLHADWRYPALKAGSCQRIWGADVMYEKRFAVPVLDFLNHALAPGGRVWLTDPGRNTFEHFIGLLLRRGWQAKRAATPMITPLYPHQVKVTVNIWELAKN